MSDEDRQRLIRLARLAVTNFNAGDWQELGVHTGALDAIGSVAKIGGSQR